VGGYSLGASGGSQIRLPQVRGGKSRNARRALSLTSRAQELLESKRQAARTNWVFTNEAGDGPLSVNTVESQQAKLRTLLKLREDFVLHGLRHTFLTRLGASNVDAFTPMRIAGHSTVAISQRYVHPTPETMEAAFERLRKTNRRAEEKLQATSERQVTTFPTTVDPAVKPLLS
jgi:integrase